MNPDASSGATTRGIIAGVLMVAVFAVYLPVRHHEFVGYDDIPYIVENPTIQQGLSAPGLWRVFSQPEHANWIPLTTLSLQLSHAVHGLEPAGYLLTNVALHALTSVLLLLLLHSLTGSTWRSAFVAGVFALHPLHVESVAWASERKDVLCGFFSVLTLFAYLRFTTQRSLFDYALLVWCLVAALLSKPMAVTLPFVMLLLDYWPLGRLQADPTRSLPDARILLGAVVEKLPLFLLVAASALVTLDVQGDGGNLNYAADLSPGTRLATVSYAYIAYLVDSFWPVGLAVFYPVPIASPAAWRVASALAFLALLTALAIRAAPRRPYLTVGWLWYLGMLVPVVGLVHVGMQARADRYMYLPQVGLCIALAWGAVDLAAAWGVARQWLLGAGIAVLFALALCSWRQVGVWRDSVALFSHAVAVTRDNPLAHYNLAAALAQAGRRDEAVAHRAKAHELIRRAAEQRSRLPVVR
jgi:hypothetical protein